MGPNAIDLLLEKGEVPKGFMDLSTRCILCKAKSKKHPFGPFADAYKIASANPPATLVVPQVLMMLECSLFFASLLWYRS
jgi:hypothetical protein